MAPSLQPFAGRRQRERGLRCERERSVHLPAERGNWKTVEVVERFQREQNPSGMTSGESLTLNPTFPHRERAPIPKRGVALEHNPTPERLLA